MITKDISIVQCISILVFAVLFIFNFHIVWVFFLGKNGPKQLSEPKGEERLLGKASFKGKK